MTNTASSGPTRAAVIFIFITVTLDVIAMGVTIPVFPRLIQEFLHGDTADASVVYGLFGTAWAVMQFFSAPILGALSDRFGRRPVLLFSMAGLGLDYIVMALAPTLAWMFLGRIISGVAAASFSTAGAYVADVTTPENRAKGFGLIGAAFSLGFVVGPALGGMLGEYDLRLPFFVSAGLCLVNALYGFFVLPESLPPERRMAFAWKRANPLGALKLLRSHHELFGLATVNFIYYIAHNVFPAVFVLYAGYRYGWSEMTIGILMAVTGVCGIIVQAGLVGPVVKRLGERNALIVGLLFGIAGFTIYASATTGFAFWFGIPVMALWAFYSPSVQGLMSKRVSPSEQGQLQGANASLMSIVSLFTPSLYTMVFAYAIDPEVGWNFPGAPFYLAAALLAVALLLALKVARPAPTIAAQPAAGGR